jgi:hypothetical protein
MKSISKEERQNCTYGLAMIRIRFSSAKTLKIEMLR